MKKQKFLSIVTPTFNEEQNIEQLVESVKRIISNYNIDSEYFIQYEHIIIDNKSLDGTREILIKLANKYTFVKLIFNNKNYGQHISPYFAVLKASGDAVLTLAADFEDPLDLIPDLIDSWLNGFKVTCAVRDGSNDSFISEFMRSCYYAIKQRTTTHANIKNFSGYGIFDKCVVDHLRQRQEPLPYFRSLVINFGYDINVIYYNKILRKNGVSSNNLYTLVDTALLGLASTSDKLSVGVIFVAIILNVFFIFITLLFLFGLLTFQAYSVIFYIMLNSIVCLSLVFISYINYKLSIIEGKLSGNDPVIVEKLYNFEKK